MKLVSKKQSKLDKILRKRNASKPEMRQLYINNKYPFLQKPEDPGCKDKEQNTEVQILDLKQQQKKGSSWWKQFDQSYFTACSHKDILFIRDFLSTDRHHIFESAFSDQIYTFEDHEVFPELPYLQDSKLIHALFKSKNPFHQSLISYSLDAQANPKLQQEDNQSSANCILKIKTINQNNEHCSAENTEQLIKQALQGNSLKYYNQFQQPQLISKIQHCQDMKKAAKDQVQTQIDLWASELDRVSSLNSIFWNKLFNDCVQNKVSTVNFQAECLAIKQTLMHNTILRYLEYGTSDKTNQMLKNLIDSNNQVKPAKTRDSNPKKFFETDCKICFCSFNSDSNQVLYCDMCNTSFHLTCYGLHKIPEQNQYFCDCCMQMLRQEEQKKAIIKKITCQVCGKANFPLKSIDGHFYHMTCLILFNLSNSQCNIVTIGNGKISLRELSHQSIQKMVVESEIQNDDCMFCGSHGAGIGMRLKCSYEGCTQSMHPICSYINGCKFSVKRSRTEKKVDVKIFCIKHDIERDYFQQTYLRRYMCNFKNTSQKSKEQFHIQYEAETSRKPKRSSFNSKVPSAMRLIQNSKAIKKYIASREQKINQRPSDQQDTESRRMLEMLTKRKN